MQIGSTPKSLNKHDVWSSIRTGLIALIGILATQFGPAILDILPFIEESLSSAIENSAKEAAAFLVALLAVGFDMIRRYLKDYSVNNYNVRDSQ